jgi:hypothetical protein
LRLAGVVCGDLDAAIMWKTILLLGIVAAVVYLYFDRRQEVREREVTVIHQTVVVGETPVRRLSAFVESHKDRIFSPLGENDTVMPAQELRQIESSLRGLQAGTRVEKDRKIYATGREVCGLLLEAVAEKQKHARRLAEMRAKGFDALLAPPERRAEEIEKKRRFFEGGVERSWESVSDRLRAEVGRRYDYLRLLER